MFDTSKHEGRQPFELTLGKGNVIKGIFEFVSAGYCKSNDFCIALIYGCTALLTSAAFCVVFMLVYACLCNFNMLCERMSI